MLLWKKRQKRETTLITVIMRLYINLYTYNTAELIASPTLFSISPEVKIILLLQIIFNYQNLVPLKNRALNRRIPTPFGQKREILTDFKRYRRIWQMAHRVNRSGTCLIAFCEITGLNSSSSVTSMSLSILAQSEVSEV